MVRARLVAIILVTGMALTGLGFIIINQVQRGAVEDQAVKTAESVVAQMLATRAVYTKDVVGKLQLEGIPAFFTEDFANQKGGVPLPATMVHLISDEVNRQGLYTIDLISPWPINPDKSPSSQWEKESVEALIKDPRSRQSRIETVGDQSRLLFMAADFASDPACVTCHNAHPASPKTDFELGDMMGSLVVSVPLTDEFSGAQREAIYIALGNIGVLAILVGLLTWLLRRASQ